MEELLEIITNRVNLLFKEQSLELLLLFANRKGKKINKRN